MGPHREVDPKLWLWWILATVAGAAVGEIVFAVLIPVVDIAYLFRAGHGVGVTVAVFQALVLRHYLDQPAWWILASGVGGVLAPLIGALVSTPVYLAYGVHGIYVATLAATALGVGLLVGTLQWLVLRRQVAQSGWWVVTSGLAVLGGLVVFFVGAILGGAAIEVVSGDLMDMDVYRIVGHLLTASVYGAITGYALVRLLRHRPVPSATPPPPASAPPRA